MKIDHNKKIPVIKSKYPIANLKTGDSFFIEGKIASQVYGAVVPTAKRIGIKVICRTVREKDKFGVRVWRTE